MTTEQESEQTNPSRSPRRSESSAARALDGEFKGPLAGLRRRIYLTYRYLGWRTLLFRALTLPLRLTPLRHRLSLRSRPDHDAYRRAVAWYREHGRPVSIVIASFRDAERVETLVRSIRATVPEGMAQIIVADDASGPEHVRLCARSWESRSLPARSWATRASPG